MKKWFRSKILWLNTVALIFTIIELATGLPELAAIQDSIVAFINIILRSKYTNTGLTR